MLEYIIGNLVERTPTQSVIENSGLAYVFQNSINSFEQLAKPNPIKIYTHVVIREDAHTMYGFASLEERSMFRSLISVSGIGPSSALAALSAYQPSQLQRAILDGDVASLKKIKGIGAKSAERIIVDLRDKMGSGDVNFDNFGAPNNTLRSEALRALRNLGFDQRKSQKVVDEIMAAHDESMSIEDLIKLSLKSL
jgi:Holliday junction DNA helicase RuvA